MFDISWTEFLLIGIVALIAIGPKELPGVLRTAGQYMGKVRRMAAEFQGQFQEAMREAEMADLKKEVDAIKDSASGLATDLNKATSLDPTAPTAASDPIPAGPPPPLAEAQPDGAVPLPAPAEQQALPPPETPPAPAATPATVDLNIPLPEAPPPVTEKDFASAPAAPASKPKPWESGA